MLPGLHWPMGSFHLARSGQEMVRKEGAHPAVHGTEEMESSLCAVPSPRACRHKRPNSARFLTVTLVFV